MAILDINEKEKALGWDGQAKDRYKDRVYDVKEREMQDFKEMDYKAPEPEQNKKTKRDGALFSKISMANDDHIQFIEGLAKLDINTSSLKSPASGQKRPAMPRTQEYGSPRTRTVPESTFDLETDFFSPPKTKIPVSSFWLDTSKTSRNETREMEVQTEVNMHQVGEKPGKASMKRDISILSINDIEGG